MKPESQTSRKTLCTADLMALFLNCGYVRRFSPEKLASRGAAAYRKGFEVRFLLHSREELEKTQRMLKAVGLRAGAPYRKNSRFVQPVYGRAALDWFLLRLPGGRECAAAGFARDGTRIRRRLSISVAEGGDGHA